MSKVLKIADDNYRISVRSGGSITLDLDYEGTVFVLGNLNVKGTQTTVESEEIALENNILTLNVGQTGNGISPLVGAQSGLEIERGDFPNAQLFFKETVPHTRQETKTFTATATTSTGNWITLTNSVGVSVGSVITFSGTVFGNVQSATPYYILDYNSGTNQIKISTILGGPAFTLVSASGSMTGTASYFEQLGSWQMKTDDGKLSGLEVEAITAGTGDLSIDMQNSGSTVRVTNTSTYTTDVSDPNTLVTKDWTETYVAAGSYATGIADVSTIYFENVTIKSRVTTDNNSIDFYIDESLRSAISVNGLDVDNINIFTNTIKNSTAANLILTSTGGNIEVDSVLQLNDKSAPSAASGKTRFWSASNPLTYTGTGKTGIYFTNLINTEELISKNRALLFSILF